MVRGEPAMPPAGRVEFHFQDEDEDIEYAPPVLEVTGAPGHPSGGLAVEPGDELKLSNTHATITCLVHAAGATRHATIT